MVSCFGFSPRWLLTGTGPMFTTGKGKEQAKSEDGRQSDFTNRLSLENGQKKWTFSFISERKKDFILKVIDTRIDNIRNI